MLGEYSERERKAKRVLLSHVKVVSTDTVAQRRRGPRRKAKRSQRKLLIQQAAKWQWMCSESQRNTMRGVSLGGDIE